MKNKYILAMSIIFSGAAYAQQVPQFTQYSQSRYILNPAATGVDEYLNISMGARKQWMGLGQEPTTYYLGAHQGFRKVHEPEKQPLALRTSKPDAFHFEQKEGSVSKLKHGVGVYLMSDEFGAFKKNTVNLSYALHTSLTDKIQIGFGANTGFNNMSFDETKAQPTELNDNTYQNFISERGNLSMVDMNLGTYIYSDKFFFGYSTNQLLGDKISFGNTTANILVLHHSIMGGYKFEVNDRLALTPSFMGKGLGGAPFNYDLNLRADFDNKYFGGMSYRNQDAVALMIGAYISDKIMLSYSYDINTSVLRNYNSGGHEIVLGYMFKK